MLNNIRNLILRNQFIKNSLFINIIYLIYLFIKHSYQNGLRYYSIKKLSQYKQSDTLVILGAGSSVNELSDRDIKYLNKFDVAGLSYSCVLPINQTYYFYETAGPNEHSLRENHSKFVFPAIIKANDEGRIKNLIWKNSEVRVFRDFVDLEDFLCPIVCNTLTGDIEVVRKLFKLFKFLHLSNLFLFQTRGSTTALTLFGLFLGYKKIIFSGVDLNDGGYFFENNENYKDYEFGDPYLVLDGKKSLVHRTNDEEYGVPVIKILKVFFEENPMIEFNVTSKSSDLSSIIPVWNRD